MSTPINLNKARKDRDRAVRKARSNDNAVTFGRTKAEKEQAKAQTDLAAKKLDAHKRET